MSSFTPKPSTSSVIFIALLGFAAVAPSLLMMNTPETSATQWNSASLSILLAGGILSVAGSAGMLFRKSTGYWLAVAGLALIGAMKANAMFAGGFQWKSLFWTLLPLFLALEALARFLGWMENDESPQVESKSIVHDYLSASLSAKCALDKMAMGSPRRAVANLTSALTSKEDQIRSGAARMLGAMGSASALPGTRKALASEDYFVRKGAIEGILTTLKNGEIENDFRSAIFDPAAALLSKCDTDSLHTELPTLLLMLDRNRAEPLLKDESLLTLRSKWLPAILNALRSEATLPPLEILRRLLRDLESGQIELWHPELYHASILKALTAVRAPEAEETLRRVIKENPTMAGRASEMLLELHGIDLMDVYCKLIDRVEASGIESLSEEEQNFYALMVFTDECNNGGIEQYFTNSSAEHAREALRALHAINAPNPANYLRRVMLLFGKQGPSQDWNERSRQIDMMAPGFFEEVERLRSETTTDEMDVMTSLHLYLMDHVSHFRR